MVAFSDSKPEVKTLRLRTKNLHFKRRVGPAVIVCTPGQPMEILPYRSAYDLDLGEFHVDLARCDPHVHARKSVVPTRDDFERLKIYETDFATTLANVHNANHHYDAYRASLAALKGGVWMIGCMGNTPWAPLGEDRWLQTLRLYQRCSLVYVHVWPRMEPGVPMITGQEGKDFGSTFGGSGLNPADRDAMYALWMGGDVSFHNDMARPDESLKDFFARSNDPVELKFHLYFNGETVLASQKETIALARKNKLRSLRARHVPTGPAFEMLLRERRIGGLELPIEVGLDYLYWNRDMLVGHPTAMINYRRPAHPSAEDQMMLITLTRENAGDESVCVATDHAPHRWKAKQYVADLPGSPGTRILEHYHQLSMYLRHKHGFTFQQITQLMAIHPARYMEKYFVDPFPYPIATMETGAMCNLVVFDPDCFYKPNVAALKQQLQDPDYHTALAHDNLRGQVKFTVVNGRVYDVVENIVALN